MFMVAYIVLGGAAAVRVHPGPHRPESRRAIRLAAAAADAVKAFFKEDFTPAHVRKVYYWLAPAIAHDPGDAEPRGDSVRLARSARRRWCSPI